MVDVHTVLQISLHDGVVCSWPCTGVLCIPFDPGMGMSRQKSLSKAKYKAYCAACSPEQIPPGLWWYMPQHHARTQQITTA